MQKAHKNADLTREYFDSEDVLNEKIIQLVKLIS